ncbi:Lysine acetyltransferase [Colletotrichum orbiculare MAFF 240422]|uniref:Lysine acetyltransferase n=1 Tax=Colletotrichum orbiculare (strain 104-T / ATCC 96160 / CBS 514.97 / LARS 414 / MAFF 240422) TaxID=1213857 RepID=N4VRI9_COLOR|nr:Lysine acetyltransferase [Colletotrichum orbiculare MAFF 240422]
MGSTHETDLVLTQPTPEERIRVWTSTHQKWGAALELDAYLRREEYLTTVPMSRNGGITQWILTTPSQPPGERPILSSCESIRKRALAARPDGTLAETVAHGIASVFTDPAHRGKGYASTMMGMLGPQLGAWQGSQVRKNTTTAAAAAATIQTGDVAFSVLFSDIGKSFYARQGWHPHASTHLSFPPSHSPPPEPSKAKPVGYHELAELASVDESLLRAKLAAKSPSSSRTRVALLPDIDAVLWHLMREDFMTTHIFGKTPTVRGAVVGDRGRRVWAVWTRGYYGGLKKPEGNTMHILRLVVEDERGSSDDYVQEAVEELLTLARAEAAEWKVNYVELWNPEPRIRGLVEKAGIPHEFVERETDSIASLMFYGEGEAEWVLNEKFGWC